MPNTVTVVHSGENRVLNQISEANGSSTYMLRTSTNEYRLNLRHSKEKAVAGATALDRHNVEFSVRTFPTVDLPLGKTETAYVVIRTDPNSDGTASELIAIALSAFVTAHSAAIVGWETTI